MCAFLFHLFKAYYIAAKPVIECVQVIKKKYPLKAGLFEAIKEMEKDSKRAVALHFASKPEHAERGLTVLGAFVEKEKEKYSLDTWVLNAISPHQQNHENVIDLLMECKNMQNQFNNAYVEAIKPIA